MEFVIALDKFKGTLTAREACRAVAAAVRARWPEAQLAEAPLTDGGEDFARILTAAAGGEEEERRVTGPRGEQVSAVVGRVPLARLRPAARRLLGKALDGELEEVALADLASASGLLLLEEGQRDPWRTRTHGVGELIGDLLFGAGAARRLVLLGVGGSATNDLGMGALEALGVRFFDGGGRRVEEVCPEAFARIARIDTARVARPRAALRIACDVSNPLLGPHGATAVFAPQKGLAVEEIPRMEAGVARMAELLGAAVGRKLPTTFPGAGAAGGIGFGLATALGAELLPGAALVRAWLGLDEELQPGRLLFTGEGCLDHGSLGGKGPVALARQGLQAGCRVVFLAGRVAAGISPAALEGAETPSGRLELIEVSPPGWGPPGREGEAARYLAGAVERFLQKGGHHGSG